MKPIQQRAQAAMAAFVVVTAMACGDDDGDASTKGSMDASVGMDAATDASGGPLTFEPIAPTDGGAFAFPTAECDPEIQAETMCGDEMCEPLTSMIAPAVCAITCCTADDQCGTRRAYLDGPTECRLPAEPDPSCPPYEIMGMVPDAGMGADAAVSFSFEGCCAPSGRCGVLSTVDNSCITSSLLLTGLMPGDECGTSQDDAGDDGDGGA